MGRDELKIGDVITTEDGQVGRVCYLGTEEEDGADYVKVEVIVTRVVERQFNYEDISEVVFSGAKHGR